MFVSNGLGLAEGAHLLHLEPLLQAVRVVVVSAFEPNTLGAEHQVLLTDGTLLCCRAGDPLKLIELLLRDTLGNLTDLVAQL